MHTTSPHAQQIDCYSQLMHKPFLGELDLILALSNLLHNLTYSRHQNSYFFVSFFLSVFAQYQCAFFGNLIISEAISTTALLDYLFKEVQFHRIEFMSGRFLKIEAALKNWDLCEDFFQPSSDKCMSELFNQFCRNLQL